jgi:hypothetical protein
MSENKNHKQDDIYSKAVRAGKRTYFFDVKSTKKGEHYLTITESKRKIDNNNGKFYFDKFKIFLYKEDFQKFSETLQEVIDVITNENGLNGFDVNNTYDENQEKDHLETETPDAYDTLLDINVHSDVNFEDLGKESDSDTPQR